MKITETTPDPAPPPPRTFTLEVTQRELELIDVALYVALFADVAKYVSGPRSAWELAAETSAIQDAIAVHIGYTPRRHRR